MKRFLTCWGGRSNINKKLPTGALKQIVAHQGTACSLEMSEFPYCWGDNMYGESGSKAGQMRSAIPFGMTCQLATASFGRKFEVDCHEKVFIGRPNMMRRCREFPSAVKNPLTVMPSAISA
jgi:hypothetical protein